MRIIVLLQACKVVVAAISPHSTSDSHLHLHSKGLAHQGVATPLHHLDNNPSTLLEDLTVEGEPQGQVGCNREADTTHHPAVGPDLNKHLL